MTDCNSLETFGEVLSAIIFDRSIGSDELLANRAMRLQDPQKRRINVQRKTINNWRNNRSKPRSIDDRQFQLVVKALKVNDTEFAALKQFLGSANDRLNAKQFKKRHVFGKPIHWGIISASGLLVMLIASVLFYRQMSSPPAHYLQEVPKSELSLSDDGFVIPDSDTRRVSTNELTYMSGWDLYVARNEIYARRGWQFTRAYSVCLQNYFDKLAKSEDNPKGWYQSKSNREELSNLESSNAETIRAYECHVRGGQYNCNGQLNQCQ